jgi:hypothetical protein
MTDCKHNWTKVTFVLPSLHRIEAEECTKCGAIMGNAAEMQEVMKYAQKRIETPHKDFTGMPVIKTNTK